MWSNGQMMNGTWSNAHDSSNYQGQFLGNQPQGPGVFSFKSGLTQAGAFDAGKWKKVRVRAYVL